MLPLLTIGDYMNYAVIGAGYGDEGKGLFTDYLAHRNPDHTVVRANGGCQAGHTVQTPEGARHVFSHFGSGSLAGNHTHLSRYFVVNPIGFRREHSTLGSPRISVSPHALVSIPQDMLVNQIKEEARGGARHGSCGWGIHETMVRPCKLTVGDLICREDEELFYILDHCRSYAPRDCLDDRLWDKNIQRSWISDLRYFLDNVDIIDDSKVDVNLIFEGAQGLGLDQDGDDFPHVTHSKTGTPNIMEYLNGIVDVYYISRCYTSRHGAGPLDQEGNLVGVSVVDPTNQPNPWQGTMRYAPLDLDVLRRRILYDWDCNPRITPHLVITCLDQAGPRINWIEGGREMFGTAFDLVDAAERATGVRVSHVSHGPTRDDVTAL